MTEFRLVGDKFEIYNNEGPDHAEESIKDSEFEICSFKKNGKFSIVVGNAKPPKSCKVDVYLVKFFLVS